MRTRVDFFSKEAFLINDSKRELANGIEKDPIHKLRLMCFSRGLTGILKLGRALRKIDCNGRTALNLKLFTTGIHEAGLSCTDQEIKDMFTRFDEKCSGSVITKELLSKLRPSIPQCRLDIIERAFNKVNPTAEDAIAIEGLRRVYSVKDHPKYLSGEVSEAQLLKQFMINFEVGGQEGVITKEEFLNYYVVVSASMDNDAYFDLVVRRAYKL